MSCHLSDVEGINACLKAVAPWFEFILGLAQITIAAAVGSLIWVIKKWRRESEHWILEKAEFNTQLDLVNRKMLLTEQQRDGLQDLLTKQADVNSQAVIAELQGRLRSVEEVAKTQAAEFWSRPLSGVLPTNIGPDLRTYTGQLSTSIPIVIFANQKGGVGKTTTAANIAAALATKGKRVLTIDLDYQGSLTHLARYQMDDQRSSSQSFINYWLEGTRSINFSDTIQEITSDLHYVSCGYAFENLERQLEYSWILGAENIDVRYRLAAILQLPFIQETYSCVILDAPPRLTTGFVNGFAAATHLFVPTVVDRLSVGAVLNFAKTFSKLQPKLNPGIKLAGVIGTMTSVGRLAGNVKPIAAQVDQHLQSILGTDRPYFIKSAVIKRDASITQCAGIAYFKNESVRPMFDGLSATISSEIFVRKPNGRAAHHHGIKEAERASFELR